MVGNIALSSRGCSFPVNALIAPPSRAWPRAHLHLRGRLLGREPGGQPTSRLEGLEQDDFLLHPVRPGREISEPWASRGDVRDKPPVWGPTCAREPGVRPLPRAPAPRPNQAQLDRVLSGRGCGGDRATTDRGPRFPQTVPPVLRPGGSYTRNTGRTS